MNILNRIASEVHLMFRRPVREQYAALCYRVRKKRSAIEILLVTSRDTGRWVIPKGWPMPDRSAADTAAREAWEEAGVKGEPEQVPLGHYVYAKGLPHGLKVDCKVHVYALEVEDICRNYPEKDQRRSEWVDCAEAARRVHEPGLKQILLDFEKARQAEPVPAPVKNAARKAR